MAATTSHHREIVQILDDMLNSEQIDKNCHEYLSDSNVRTAEFYMLPKIHKNPTNPPGRPIVSGNGCPTERISKCIDHFLLRYVIYMKKDRQPIAFKT